MTKCLAFSPTLEQPAPNEHVTFAGKHADLGASYNPLEDLIQHFFRHETVVWDVKVRLGLAEDPTKADADCDFPIKKADKPWPEQASPWITVARITALPQHSYSDARQLSGDEQLSFTPWHALAAHQPLGGIMRARLKAYEEAAKYRAQRNNRIIAEPPSIDQIPA